MRRNPSLSSLDGTIGARDHRSVLGECGRRYHAAEGLQTTSRTEEQQRADRDADRAYRAMMKQVSDKPRDTDPWTGVRNRDTAPIATGGVDALPRGSEEAASGTVRGKSR